MMDPELIRIIEDNNLKLHGDIEYFAEMVAQREREACAKLCLTYAQTAFNNSSNNAAMELHEAIRARGRA